MLVQQPDIALLKCVEIYMPGRFAGVSGGSLAKGCLCPGHFEFP